MDKAEFRAWLGSDAATQQLSAALAETEVTCDGCGLIVDEDAIEEMPYDLSVLNLGDTLCAGCIQSLIDGHEYGPYIYDYL